MYGMLDKLGIGVHVEFGADMFAVSFHGFHTDRQIGGDFLGSKPLSDEPKDFQFAIG
jgi:hypothetical protein